MSSETIIEEQIKDLNNQIDNEKKENQELEEIIKEIPKEMIEEYSANKELDEVSLDLLEEALLIMEKLDYIKNKNNI